MDLGLCRRACRQRPGVADLCLAKTGAHQLSANRRGSRRPKGNRRVQHRAGRMVPLDFCAGDWHCHSRHLRNFFRQRGRSSAAFCSARCCSWIWGARICLGSPTGIIAQKYASNPIVDILRDKPYEHRVIQLPFRVPDQFTLFNGNRGLYGIEWVQQLFPYYNIQSLDIVMRPRVGSDVELYEINFLPTSEDRTYLLTRHWQLTNTRYLLGPAGFLDVVERTTRSGATPFPNRPTFHHRAKTGRRTGDKS